MSDGGRGFLSIVGGCVVAIIVLLFVLRLNNRISTYFFKRYSEKKVPEREWGPRIVRKSQGGSRQWIS